MTLAVIAGGSNGKMVTALLGFFLFGCVSVSQEEILSVPQREYFINLRIKLVGRGQSLSVQRAALCVQGSVSGAWLELSWLPWH